MVAASSMIGRCTSRKAPMPISQISTPAISAIAGIGAPCVLSHGRQPARIRPTGSRCCSDEQIGRPDAEHHQRMAVQPILQAAPARQRQIFAHRQRVDVADAAALEIAGGGMMHGMRAPPEIVGRQGEHAEHAADPVIGQAMAEERAMAAIVLDHEQPHQEAGGRQRRAAKSATTSRTNRTATSAPTRPPAGRR